MKRCLREVLHEEGGIETLSCGHTQWRRFDLYGRRDVMRRECDTCQQEAAEREGERIASFGGPRLL